MKRRKLSLPLGIEFNKSEASRIAGFVVEGDVDIPDFGVPRKRGVGSLDQGEGLLVEEVFEVINFDLIILRSLEKSCALESFYQVPDE